MRLVAAGRLISVRPAVVVVVALTVTSRREVIRSRGWDRSTVATSSVVVRSGDGRRGRSAVVGCDPVVEAWRAVVVASSPVIVHPVVVHPGWPVVVSTASVIVAAVVVRSGPSVIVHGSSEPTFWLAHRGSGHEASPVVEAVVAAPVVEPAVVTARWTTLAGSLSRATVGAGSGSPSSASSGLFDRDGSVVKGSRVQGSHGGIGILRGLKVDERKASRLSGVWVSHDLALGDLAKFAKDLLEITVFGFLSKARNVEVVAGVDIVAGALISTRLSAGC